MARKPVKVEPQPPSPHRPEPSVSETVVVWGAGAALASLVMAVFGHYYGWW